MDNKKKFERFVKKSKEKFGDKFDYSITNYINSSTKIKLICRYHGIIEIIPNNHLISQTGCPKCSHDVLREQRQIGKEKFIAICEEKFKNLNFDYSQVEYVNYLTPVKIICPIHGEFIQTPQNIMNSKYGCRKCAISARNGGKSPRDLRVKQVFEDFKSLNFQYKYPELEEICKNNPEYLLKYRDKIKAICPIHGEIELLYETHIKGAGCRKCANENNSVKFEKFIELAKYIHGEKYSYDEDSYVNFTSKCKIICKEHGTFYQKPEDHIRGKQGCPKCSNVQSKQESEITEIFSNSVQFTTNDRHLISPYEIDILIPDHKVAIEFNGLLWHSYGKCYPNNIDEISKKYHQIKTDLCEPHGYQLLHIFENEWLDPIKQNIWKSIIKAKLNLISYKIYGRNCKVEEISSLIATKFLEKNHLQGSGRIGKVRLGLFHNNELISVMTFGKPSISKSKAEYELIRFASKLNTIVVGGASKLLSFFERKYSPKSIISYANRRWSNGNLYRKLGFNLVRKTEPNYFYFKCNSTHLQSRNSFQKYKLKEKLEYFDENLSELENMINNNFRIIYDAGNLVYLKEYK